MPSSASPIPSRGLPAKLLSRRVRDVFAHYPKALVGDVEAVHDLRVASRRLRVALQLLAGKPEGKRARRADHRLRDVARAAGISRDMDVAASVLAPMAAARRRDPASWATLLRAMRGTRSRGRHDARETLLDLDIAELRKDLRWIAARGAIDAESLTRRVRALADDQGGKLLNRLETTRARLDPIALHEVRRRSRRLRYGAEIADALLATDSGAPKFWRLMQNRLGEIHDRQVLVEWLDERVQRAERGNDPGLARAARLARHLARRDARRLYREAMAALPTDLAREALEAMRPAEPSPVPSDPVVVDFPRVAG